MFRLSYRFYMVEFRLLGEGDFRGDDGGGVNGPLVENK